MIFQDVFHSIHPYKYWYQDIWTKYGFINPNNIIIQDIKKNDYFLFPFSFSSQFQFQFPFIPIMFNLMRHIYLLLYSISLFDSFQNAIWAFMYSYVAETLSYASNISPSITQTPLLYPRAINTVVILANINRIPDGRINKWEI